MKTPDSKSNAIENREMFSGTLGILLVPDRDTIEKVGQIGEQFSHMLTWKTPFPHITLYESKLKHVPESAVRSILKDAKDALPPDGVLRLGPLVVYGGKFLFWNVEDQDSLRNAHE